jgi:hypothetical protein
MADESKCTWVSTAGCIRRAIGTIPSGTSREEVIDEDTQ